MRKNQLLSYMLEFAFIVCSITFGLSQHLRRRSNRKDAIAFSSQAVASWFVFLPSQAMASYDIFRRGPPPNFFLSGSLSHFSLTFTLQCYFLHSFPLYLLHTRNNGRFMNLETSSSLHLEADAVQVHDIPTGKNSGVERSSKSLNEKLASVLLDPHDAEGFPPKHEQMS